MRIQNVEYNKIEVLKIYEVLEEYRRINEEYCTI